MKGLLIVIAGVLAVVALARLRPARPRWISLAQHHVCVSDSGRQVISTAQKNHLEKQIGNEPSTWWSRRPARRLRQRDAPAHQRPWRARRVHGRLP